MNIVWYIAVEWLSLMKGKICGLCQGSQSAGESDREQESQHSE